MTTTLLSAFVFMLAGQGGFSASADHAAAAISVAAVGTATAGDPNYCFEFNGFEASGGVFEPIAMDSLVGTLTEVKGTFCLDIDAENSTWCNDLTILIGNADLSYRHVQIGGWNDLGATHRYQWGGGDSDGAGTCVDDLIPLDNIDVSGYYMHLGNGYNNGGPGQWSGVICLYGAEIWDPLYGACCFGPGDCWETDDQDCDSSGGSFYENESCDEACPTYYGACCFSPGDCYETEEWDCMDSGGDFYQDEYCEDVCADDPNYGACCFLDGDCYQAEEYECTDAGGDFYQDANCMDVCYDPAYGGCCIGFAGDCQVLTENECYAKNGEYLGDDTDCQWDPCYVEPEAACCLGSNNCQDTTQQECFDWGGEWAGSGTSCADHSCGETGACCVGDFDCSDDYEDDCNWLGGSFQGEGTSCDDYPCGSPSGACCFSPGDCYETEEHKCYDAGGDFWQDAFCEDVCYAVTPEGACCIDGDCSIWEEQDCDNIEGTYFGDGSECAGIECPPPPPMNMGYSVVGTNFVSGVGFNWTLDLYVTLPDGWRVDAVAGNSDQNKTLVCTGGFYQNPNGGPLSSDLNPNNYQFDSNLEWDSRVTIGALDMSGNPFGSNSVASIGIDWTDFESGLGLDVNNGTWYILPTEDQGNAQPFTNNDCQVRYGVLVARVTALGADSTVSMEGLVVAREDGQSNSQQLEISATEIPWVETTDCNANGINDACDIANGSSDDADGNGVPDECEQGDCVGDYNGDGQTNIDDILHVIGGWDNPYAVEDILAVLDDYGCGG